MQLHAVTRWGRCRDSEGIAILKPCCNAASLTRLHAPRAAELQRELQSCRARLQDAPICTIVPKIYSGRSCEPPSPTAYYTKWCCLRLSFSVIHRRPLPDVSLLYRRCCHFILQKLIALGQHSGLSHLRQKLELTRCRSPHLATTSAGLIPTAGKYSSKSTKAPEPDLEHPC